MGLAGQHYGWTGYSSTHWCWSYLKQSKMNIFVSLSAFLYGAFHKPDACLNLTITLVMVWQCHDLVYVQALAKVLKLLWNKICACIWNQLFGQAKLSKHNLACSYQVFGWQALHLFHNQELAAIIYNGQQIFIINHKYICTNHLPQLGWNLVGCCPFLQLLVLVLQTSGTFLMVFSILAFIFTQYTDCVQVILSFQLTLVLLLTCLLIATLSLMANSCLMGQYFCMSCAMSSFLCGQPFISLHLLQVCISCCHFWYIMYWCTQWQVHCYLYHTDIYIEVLDLFVFILFMVVLWWLIYNEHLGAWLTSSLWWAPFPPHWDHTLLLEAHLLPPFQSFRALHTYQAPSRWMLAELILVWTF